MLSLRELPLCALFLKLPSCRPILSSCSGAPGVWCDAGARSWWTSPPAFGRLALQTCLKRYWCCTTSASSSICSSCRSWCWGIYEDLWSISLFVRMSVVKSPVGGALSRMSVSNLLTLAKCFFFFCASQRVLHTVKCWPWFSLSEPCCKMSSKLKMSRTWQYVLYVLLAMSFKTLVPVYLFK